MTYPIVLPSIDMRASRPPCSLVEEDDDENHLLECMDTSLSSNASSTTPSASQLSLPNSLSSNKLKSAVLDKENHHDPTPLSDFNNLKLPTIAGPPTMTPPDEALLLDPLAVVTLPSASRTSAPTPPSPRPRRPKVLCLGMSYPDVNHLLAMTPDAWPANPTDTTTSSAPAFTMSQIVIWVRRGLLTEMDGRDLARCILTEQYAGVDVYTVSQEQGALYRSDRHVHANFNRTMSFIKQLQNLWLDRADQQPRPFHRKNTEQDHTMDDHHGNDDDDDGLIFDQVILDYFWIPTGWDHQHWHRSFFRETIPALHFHGLLHPTRGAVYLPHTWHTFRQVVSVYGPSNRQAQGRRRLPPFGSLKEHFHLTFVRKQKRSNPGAASTTAITELETSSSTTMTSFTMTGPSNVAVQDVTAVIPSSSLPAPSAEQGDIAATVTSTPATATACAVAGTVASNLPLDPELSEIALWKGTQFADALQMQGFLGKRLDQEELYCTFGPRHVGECMPDPMISDQAVLKVARSLSDFGHIRFLCLKPIPEASNAAADDDVSDPLLSTDQDLHETTTSAADLQLTSSSELDSNVMLNSQPECRQPGQRGRILGLVRPRHVRDGFDQYGLDYVAPPKVPINRRLTTRRAKLLLQSPPKAQPLTLTDAQELWDLTKRQIDETGPSRRKPGRKPKKRRKVPRASLPLEDLTTTAATLAAANVPMDPEETASALSLTTLTHNAYPPQVILVSKQALPETWTANVVEMSRQENPLLSSESQLSSQPSWGGSAVESLEEANLPEEVDIFKNQGLLWALH